LLGARSGAAPSASRRFASLDWAMPSPASSRSDALVTARARGIISADSRIRVASVSISSRFRLIDMRRKQSKQLTLALRRHGGARIGAGRAPNGAVAGVRHSTRETRCGREPVLVTMKLRAGLTSLRTRSVFARVLESLVGARERFGSRITHFSVQRDHVHLVIETRGTPSMSRAMQGLAVRLTRAVNRTMNRRGTVFTERFHDRVLRTPRQVRHALAYVLCNARKHGVAPRRRRQRARSSTIDWTKSCASWTSSVRVRVRV
jgi:REP element-mobilizing transposase RayT